MTVYIYNSKKRMAANPSSPKIGIKVKNGIITDAWYFIPGGQWNGSHPVELIGEIADEKFLRDYYKAQKEV